MCRMKLTYAAFSIVRGPQGTLQAANKDQRLNDTVGKPRVGSNFTTVIIQLILDVGEVTISGSPTYTV